MGWRYIDLYGRRPYLRVHVHSIVSGRPKVDFSFVHRRITNNNRIEVLRALYAPLAFTFFEKGTVIFPACAYNVEGTDANTRIVGFDLDRRTCTKPCT